MQCGWRWQTSYLGGLRWNSVLYLPDVKMAKPHLSREKLCCVCTERRSGSALCFDPLSASLPPKRFCPSLCACQRGSCLRGLSTSTLEPWGPAPAVPLSHLETRSKSLPLSCTSSSCVCKSLGQDLSRIICTRGLANCHWVPMTGKDAVQLLVCSK